MIVSVDDRWRAVAEAVRRRRLALGLTVPEACAASAGMVSVAVWSILENARQDRYKERSLAGVAKALQWPPDAIERVLAGEDPALLTAAPADDRAETVEQRVEALAAKLGELERSLAERDRVIEELRRRLEDEQSVRKRPRPPGDG
jgi:transcriptional regulator with XRE-family HTH domain